MGIPAVVAILRLSRIRSSILAFLTMFVPTYVDGQDAGRSLALSIPIFLISVCTFIFNDLNDLESDRINHPERPLPSGLVSPEFTATVFAVTLSTSIITIVLFVDSHLCVWYFVLLTLGIAYNIIVNCLAALKTVYVASVVTLGLVLVSRLSGSEFHVSILATAFFFVLGRELLMDVQDLRGDSSTLVSLISPRTATTVAFSLQAVSVFIILSVATPVVESMAAFAVAAVLLVVIWGWQNKERRRLLLQLMQIQMLAGITFLV